MGGKDRRERYSLVGPDAKRSAELGLVGATWFRSDVPRRRMKELMHRSDSPAVRDLALWLGGMIFCAAVSVVIWPHWAAVPFLLIYGVLYGSASDARQHETAHGTPYRTKWLNEFVFRISSFMLMRDPTVYRWSHTRHHTDTLILGQDPEIEVMRPARLARLLANLFGLVDVPLALRDLVVHATGRLRPAEQTFVPVEEWHKVYRTARISLLIFVGVGVSCALLQSVIPLLLVGGPRVYGTFMRVIYTLTQHAGMGENVLDHRLNTRTIYMCRINRFLYWNMNYHVEHHMFPMVPYHRLPELHKEVVNDLAPAYPSLWSAYKEIIPSVLRQLKDQTYYVRRELLPGAPPYKVSELADGHAP